MALGGAFLFRNLPAPSRLLSAAPSAEDKHTNSGFAGFCSGDGL